MDGHTAGAKYEKLSIISRSGVNSCHESITSEEVLERLRLGFHVLLRESSLRQDLRGLLKAVRGNPFSLRRVMLTTDGSSPAFHLESGMTDHLVRIAIDEGIDPVEVYRMVTLNPAVYFGFENRLGGVAPGRDADILVIGQNPGAMASAVNRVVQMGGGIAAVEKGEVAFECPLPIGGMMSERPLEEAAKKEAALREFLSRRGYPFHDPLYTFIFLLNDFLPEVRINRKGMVDIKKDEVLWPARRLGNVDRKGGCSHE